MALTIVVLPVLAQAPAEEAGNELVNLSLEDLMDVEFYSASKKLEPGCVSGATAGAAMEELDAELFRLRGQLSAFRIEMIEGAA